MKVAYINSVVGYGSTGRIVYQLSHMDGIQGKVYYGRKENNTDADAYRMTKFIGNAKHAMSTFVKGNHGFSNTQETKDMVEDLMKFNPSLVHLHNLHGFYLDMEVLFEFLRETQVPVVWTLHDCWSFTGHCAHFEASGCEKWKNGCEGRCPGALSYPYTFNPYCAKKNYAKKNELVHLLGRNQMTIVTPSNWLEDRVKESFLKDFPVRTIHTGINTEVFYYRNSVFRKHHDIINKYMILAVASVWYKDKGLDDLVRIANHLKQNQVLVIVGVNERQKHLFTGLNVICVNRTADVNELCEIYSSADVLINPTYQDTFPTVNLEAMACGTPVITYQTGGSPESLTNKTGIVIEKGNVQEMEHTIEQLQKKEIILESKHCVEQARRYKEENMLLAYRALYVDKVGTLL